MSGRDDTAFTAIVLEDADCVAHALVPLRAGDTAEVRGPRRHFTIRVLEDVPRYHKLATVDLETGATVTKAGEAIGRAAAPIRAGEHVHTHNLKSTFGGIGSSV